MKIDITKRLPEVDAAIAKTDNPRHLAILKNYTRHAILEVCGLYEDIVAPDMIVPHPIYRFHEPNGFRILDGMAAVKAEYQSYAEVNNTVMYHTDGVIVVHDQGFLTEYTSNRFWPGKLLRDLGDEIDDPEATYLVTMSQAMAWPYDDQARLIEERVYRGRDRKIRKCVPEEIVTVQECRERLLPIMPPVTSPHALHRAESA
jgi:hypothetical protein